MLISQRSRFAELQSRIDGQVLTAGDEAWDASRQTFNLTHDQQPAALVRVASAEDVAETVRYAAKHGLRVAPQSTGHNAGPIEASRTRCSSGPTSSRRSASTSRRAAPAWAQACAGAPWPTPPPPPGSRRSPARRATWA